MILPDVNVLLYAFRKDVPQHTICKPWLERVVGGEAAYAISRLALSALVRISTGRRTYAVPSTIDEAFDFCEKLVARPNCRIIEPGERHWSIFERLCREHGVTGPDVTDAYHAALAIEWGCEWITLDRGFARFRGLRWREPKIE
jgi:toxin-antitoxin system PIN domain toxin